MIRLVIASIFLVIMGVPSLAIDSIIQDELETTTTTRATGMGNAFTSLAHSEGAIRFNPAGLALKGGQYSFQLLDFKAKKYQHNYFHSIYLSPYAYSYSKMVEKNNHELVMHSFAYGQKGSKYLDWGVSIKNIRGKSNQLEFSGITSDLGIMIHLLPFMDLGIVGRNIIDKDIDIAPAWLTGASLFTPKRNLMISADLLHQSSNNKSSIIGRYGLEYAVAKGFVARGGWDDDHLTAGIGLVFKSLEVEYGVTFKPKSYDADLHMISFKLGKGTEIDQFRKKYSILKPKSYAIMELGGRTVEGKTEVSLVNGQKIGSNELIQLIRFAREDSSCKGFIIRLTQFNSQLSGFGLVDEIRYELMKAKRLKKEVIVYIDHWATLSEYYLASIADTIYMPELGTISHLGIELEVQKIKQLLSNFGVGNDSIGSGAFKDRLSSETDVLSLYEKREVEDFVGNLYNHILSNIRYARQLSDQAISIAFTGQFITGAQAKTLGLIDEFGYWSELPEKLELGEKNVEDKIAGLALEAYKEPTPQETFFPLFNRIAVIEIDGPIVEGRNKSNLFFGGKVTGADDIEFVIDKIKQSPEIKGVILRINSPGGSMFATAQIYDALTHLRAKNKIVYVSMGNIAASGGYYISLNSDKIFANPITILGSVGVISSYRNYQDLYDVIGIEHDVISTGEYMSVGKSRKALSVKEKAMLERHQDYYYQYFVNKLIHHRHFSEKEAYTIAQGQLFLGKQAQSLSLIDELGSFQDVIDELSLKLDIIDPKVITYQIEPEWEMPRSLLRGIISPLKGIVNSLSIIRKSLADIDKPKFQW